MPKLSIITINLNNKDGLQKTISSVINQTYKDFEYIIMDGGSSDGSLDVIKEYADRITYWVSEPDKGIYDAMNKGIIHSRGDWVIFMNSGDIFADNSVIQKIFLTKPDSNTYILYGNTIIANNDERIKPSSRIKRSFFFFNTICHQSIFFKRDIFEIIGYHDLKYRIIADRDILLRVTLRKFKFHYIDIDICKWDSGGISSTNIELFKTEENAFRKYYFSNIEIIKIRLFNKVSTFKYKIFRALTIK